MSHSVQYKKKKWLYASNSSCKHNGAIVYKNKNPFNCFRYLFFVSLYGRITGETCTLSLFEVSNKPLVFRVDNKDIRTLFWCLYCWLCLGVLRTMCWSFNCWFWAYIFLLLLSFQNVFLLFCFLRCLYLYLFFYIFMFVYFPIFGWCKLEYIRIMDTIFVATYT